jgi:class 3 adenylate cyclase/tetratricopeptide (TPR) repeat protein
LLDRAQAYPPAVETVLCPSCGEENPAKFRLCGYCGTPLAPGIEQPLRPEPVAPRLPAREIRKTVTLVFTDIKDSTALTGSIDAEAMNEIKARYFSSMGDRIRDHGGEVEKNIGDAIMAVFGRIRAHEDDALRAVRAAHEMQTVLAEINEEFERGYGVRITNRTGVNTGEIVANTDPRADQNLATGDAVNVAARLEQNAPAGEVLIGEITYELVRHHVDVERLDLELKGKPDPVPAYRLLGMHDLVVPSPGDQPLFGRADELRFLRETYDAMAAERLPRMVVVNGDAGVGKTRLIADFVRQLAGRALVLRGRCLTYGNGITFWPLVEIVRTAAQIGEADSAEAARAKIAALLPADGADRDAVVDRVATAIGLSSGDHPVTELFWGARKLLEAQTGERPLVVVVDDVHWAEATFLELLDQLVGSPTPAPILVVCSSRPELSDVHPDWWAQREGSRVELSPLGAEAVEEMIDRLLGQAALSSETRRRVMTAAEGNPLYVEQMVSMLRDHDPGEGEIVVPPTITALLSARLDALSHPERAVIEPASVIGLHFPAPAIGHLVPDDLRPEVGSHLDTLQGKQLIQPSSETGEDDAYRFHHVLVRDATYGSLLKRARALLHERFVEWAEPVNRERGREIEFEEILGYHLEQAVRYRSELGPLDDHGRDLAVRAATRLAGAGMRALERLDTPAAVNLLQRAIDLRDDLDPARLELVPELGEALMGLSRFDDAKRLLDQAAEAVFEIDDPRLSGRIRLRRLALGLFGEDTQSAPAVAEAQAETEEILTSLISVADHGGAARAWRLLLLIHGNAGHYDDLAVSAERLMDEARLSDEPRLVRQGATGYAIGSVLGSTPVTEALAVCERILTEVEGDRLAEAIVCGALAQLHAMRGDFEVARQRYHQEVALLSDLDVSRESASTSIDSARVEVLAGDLATAEAHLRRDDAQLAGMGERYFRSTVVGMLGRVLMLRGQLDDAEAFVVLAETLSDADDAWSQVLWRSTRARLVAAGFPERGLELATQGVDFAATTTDLALRGDALSDLAEVLVITGSPLDARETLMQALALYQRKGDATSAARCRTRLERLDGSGPAD